MSGEEQVSEERWRRVGVSGSLMGRRSEEMTQSNAFFRRGSEVPEGVMAIEVPQNEEISGGWKNEGRKEVSSAIFWRGANRRAYTLRNDSEEELLRELLTPT